MLGELRYAHKNYLWGRGFDPEHLGRVWGFRLEMSELYDWEKIDLSSLVSESLYSSYLNTGVPHCVFEVSDVDAFPVYDIGKKVRYSPLFSEGANANFFEKISEHRLKLRTYERGVEAETLACGTGATATALVAAKKYSLKDYVELEVPGGLLVVKFTSDFKRVELCGNVNLVFSGKLNI